jgi:cytochrome b6-f complex iron-sulfur subunit
MHTLDVEQQPPCLDEARRHVMLRGKPMTAYIQPKKSVCKKVGAFAAGMSCGILGVMAVLQVASHSQMRVDKNNAEEGMVQGFGLGAVPFRTPSQTGSRVGLQENGENDPEASMENLQTMKSVLDNLHFVNDVGATTGISEVLTSLHKRFEKNPGAVAVIPLIPAERLNVMPKMESANQASRSQVVMSASTAPVPDMQRRTIMNLLVLGVGAVPVGWMLGGYIYFFIPPDSGGGGGGIIAKDAGGQEVTFDGWLASHQALDRSLVEGLKGDAHYLIVTEDGTIENYAINAVCTHLGCVVPWNRAQNKYMCPCHGSQYDNTGKVVRGPAPLSLALAHVDNADGKVSLRPWKETDFRTGTNPWWK